jgi:hypothetical protein
MTDGEVNQRRESGPMLTLTSLASKFKRFIKGGILFKQLEPI